ncbi:MAG TPA: hypothetical protein VFA11_14180 [Acidimicrobiales bacterium]|nr:hypothetical protein [Acidimicrobiales bacterium]
MGESTAEISSLATGLEELTRRVTSIADRYAAAHREDVAADLYAAERNLTAAWRRLSKVMASES